ncbi:MAG: YCF48-related protein [Cyanobacteria bacterium J06635_1]
MNFKKQLILGLILTISLIGWSLSGKFDPAWAHDPHDVVQQVELSPTYDQDQTVYLLVRGNFLKSQDGGATWQRQVMGLTAQGAPLGFAVSSQQPNQLYLGTEGDGVYKSVDGGESWQPVNKGLPELAITQIAVSPTHPDAVLAAGHNGHIFRSDNGGQGWSEVLATALPVSAIAFSPTQPEWVVAGDRQGHLYRSADSGQTWSPLSSLPESGTITSLSFPIGAAAGQFWVGTEQAGVLRTLDGGKTFTTVNEGLSETTIQSIVGQVAPGKDRPTLYVSTANDGVFFSEDGERWQPMDGGLTKTGQADKMGFPHFTRLALSPSFDQDGTVLVSGFNGLFKTTDRGQTWAQLDTLAGDIVMAVALSPNYVTDGTVVAATYVGEAYLSQDRGDTWQPMAKGLELPYFTDSFESIERNDDPRRFQALAFSPNYGADQTLFGTILNNGVLRYNQKQGWRLHRFQKWERAIAIAPSPDFSQDQTLFIVGQKGRVHRSRNGGKTFSKVGDIEAQFGNESPFMVISPEYANDQTVYITGPAGVYKTTDAGKVWQTVTDAAQFETRRSMRLAISPDYANDQTLWLGSSEGLFQTQDGGATWAEVSGAYGEQPYIDAIAISPSYAADQTMIISVRGQGLFKSTDGGETFVSVGDAALPLSIISNFESSAMPLMFSPNYAADQTLYGFGPVQSEIFKSTDGGQTWQSQSLPRAEIFDAYNRYQYSFASQARLFWYLHQAHFLKWLLASVTSGFSYFALSLLSRRVKSRWLAPSLRWATAGVIMCLSLFVLFG